MRHFSDMGSGDEIKVSGKSGKKWLIIYENSCDFIAKEIDLMFFFLFEIQIP